MDKKFFEEIIYQNKSNRLKESFIERNFNEFYSFIMNSYNGDTFLEKLYVYYIGYNICVCGKKTSFISFKIGFLKFCSVKCSRNNEEVKSKYRETCIDRYGKDNPSKSIEVQNKKEETFMKRYGKKTYLQTDQVKCIISEKYECDNVFKNEEIKKKIKNTNIIKYGVDHFTKTDVYKSNVKSTCIERYGVDHYSKTDEFKILQSSRNYEAYKSSFNLKDYTLISKVGFTNTIKHNLCGNIFDIQTQLIRKKSIESIEICSFCNPYIPSYKEIELFNFISEIYNSSIIRNYRDKYEIDIYLPELKIGIEYNGLYWHSDLYKDVSYHRDKYLHFKKVGIRLINVWEDDWKYKKDIVKSILSHKLNKTSNTFFARKCKVEIISDVEAKDFLNNNHLQGWCVSKYRISIRLNNEIVALATFGSERINLGSKAMSDNYELLRFCVRIGVSIPGGFSKILKFFIKTFTPKKILTYADISISDGGLYENNGFNFKSETTPNYYYFISDRRINRFNFNKSKLVNMGYDKSKTEKEIMFENGYHRIYDCGSMKYEMIL